jgi:hypothetical protein
MRVRLAKKRAKQGDGDAKAWLERRRWRLARPQMRAVTKSFIQERLAQESFLKHIIPLA